MFNIEISNIKENQLYHFTKKENLEKISFHQGSCSQTQIKPKIKPIDALTH